MLKNNKTFVIALGGNSILRSNQGGTTEEQYTNLLQTGHQLLDLLSSDNRIVITHGNGPQVGNLLLALETARDLVPPMPLDLCGASTQGYMGSMIQLTLANCLRESGQKHNITTVISQVIVDKNDPAFNHPSKPVGSFHTFHEAEKLRTERGWEMIEDSSRGYRRVVPSPQPLKIQQSRIIKSMLDAGEIVIALGGGGVPVTRERNGSLQGVEAVIDKDLASSCLAKEIEADVLLILTAVEKVYLDFGSSSQTPLDCLSIPEAINYLDEGQFGKGSMEPKISAGIDFLKVESDREREVYITVPEKALSAMQGHTGTRITV